MSDITSRAQHPTPLHARTAELCTTNSWTEECGFTIPALYTSPREEHEALTARVTLSDLSARQCWLIDGADAAAFLSVLTVSDAARIEPGQTARTLWCDDTGFVRGEGLLARFAATTFELSTTVRDFAWVNDALRGFDVKLVNATGSRAVIGIRGPRTQALLAAAGLSAEASSTGSVTHPTWRPAQVALMRDATGEGIELWMQAEDGAVVWDRLWRSGASLGVAAAGAATLEATRIENAIAKPAVDWQPAHLAIDASDMRTPGELGFAPDPTRRYNGADAARRPRAKPQVLVQLTAETELVTGPVAVRNVVAGKLTSTAWSESRAAAVALAWLDADVAKMGAKVSAPTARGTTPAEVTREVFAAEARMVGTR
jgi:glycine cleavage system aminomethyltransferase T